MKFIKKHKILVFFIICFVLGFIMMPLFHGGYINNFLNSYTSVKWYYHILLVLGVFLLTLILHELTHFLTFVFSGFENEALIILVFVFYKLKGRWKLKVDFKLLALGGGLAFPNLGIINNDEDYKKAKKATLKSLIIAPLFTLISGLVFFSVVAIFFYKFPFLLVISLYYLLFSLFYTYASTIETANIKGDFKAYKHVKNDTVFASLVVFQYAEVSEYTYNRAKEILFDLPLNNDLIQASFLSLVTEKQVFEDDIVDIEVYNYLYSYLNKPTFRRLLFSYDNFKVAQSLMLYFNKCGFTDNVAEMFSLFERRLMSLNIKDNQKSFLLKQTLHILEWENNADFINNPKNMLDGDLSFIIKHIPSFIEGELNRNKGVKHFILECKI